LGQIESTIWRVITQKWYHRSRMYLSLMGIDAYNAMTDSPQFQRPSPYPDSPRHTASRPRCWPAAPPAPAAAGDKVEAAQEAVPIEKRRSISSSTVHRPFLLGSCCLAYECGCRVPSLPESHGHQPDPRDPASQVNARSWAA
jgi:hypothetical protein